MRATVPLLYPSSVNWEGVILSQMEMGLPCWMELEVMQNYALVDLLKRRRIHSRTGGFG
jgi:hypothetical protein